MYIQLKSTIIYIIEHPIPQHQINSSSAQQTES